MAGLVAQFIRFLGIVFLNTAVDFAVLNMLMFYFGFFTGTPVGLFSAVSFLIAVTHSYFWNRYLVFKKTDSSESITSNLGEFIYAGILGAAGIVLAGFGGSPKHSSAYYLMLLGGLVIGELIFWHAFRIGSNTPAQKSRQEFFYFIVITAVG